MRKWAALLLLAGTALPAMAAKNLSVAELEQLLTSNQGKADGHVAQQLSEVELTERLSPARFARWEENFSGSKTREQLLRLADTAAFLKPSFEDVIKDPAPYSETQARMFDLANEYVRKTFSQLPNFVATRSTTHFEDLPSIEQGTPDSLSGLPGRTGPHNITIGNITIGKSEAKPLHIAGTSSVAVTYRNGSEVHDGTGKDLKQEASPAGLTTYGEFGPLLGIVLGDASRSQVTWSHWEQGESEPIAVFHYSVPEDRSNFIVKIPNGSKTEQSHPGYHGEIAIEPATGSVMRLSAIADLANPQEMDAVAILVEYASVQIGDRAYVCPVHGVAYSKIPVEGGQATQNSAAMVQIQLNDVAFTQYHLFGSDAHIVADPNSQTDLNLPSNAAAAAAAPASSSDSSSAPANRGR